MLFSFALIFLIGLLAGAVFQKGKLPAIIGMLVTGILIGPYAGNLLDSSVLGISSELRQIALLIILIKAGFALNPADLKQVGRPAVLLSFFPALSELSAYLLFAPVFFSVSYLEAAVMGTVLSAVSPAVVVPRMVKLIEEKRGTDKCIPQMILAGASCDDIFVIVLFSTFITMIQGGSVHVMDFVSIPVSMVLGILAGILAGWILSFLFETAYRKQHAIRNSKKVILILAAAFLLMTIETGLSSYIKISGLLAVVAMACIINKKTDSSVSERLAEKFGKLWIAAEVILFVLVGAAVDIRYTLTAGLPAVCMIFIALLFRSAGVWLCLTGTALNLREKCFCIIAYLPKATVQAAIGSVPLTLGLPCGKLILSVAVLAILITAPLGALGIDSSYKKILS